MPSLIRIKPGGVAEYWEPLGVTEVHCSTCAHCQHHTEFPSMRRMHEYVDVCRGCMKLICIDDPRTGHVGCAGKPCRPWEKECERMEREARIAAKVESSRWRCY